MLNPKLTVANERLVSLPGCVPTITLVSLGRGVAPGSAACTSAYRQHQMVQRMTDTEPSGNTDRNCFGLQYPCAVSGDGLALITCENHTCFMCYPNVTNLVCSPSARHSAVARGDDHELSKHGQAPRHGGRIGSVEKREGHEKLNHETGDTYLISIDGNLQKRSIVAVSSAVVRCRKHCDQMAAGEVLIPVLYTLVRANDQLQSGCRAEIFDSVRTILAYVVSYRSPAHPNTIVAGSEHAQQVLKARPTVVPEPPR